MDGTYFFAGRANRENFTLSLFDQQLKFVSQLWKNFIKEFLCEERNIKKHFEGDFV